MRVSDFEMIFFFFFNWRKIFKKQIPGNKMGQFKKYYIVLLKTRLNKDNASISGSPLRNQNFITRKRLCLGVGFFKCYLTSQINILSEKKWHKNGFFWNFSFIHCAKNVLISPNGPRQWELGTRKVKLYLFPFPQKCFNWFKIEYVSIK